MKNTCRAGVAIEADKPCPRCGANRGGSCAIGDMQAEAELRAEIARLKAELERTEAAYQESYRLGTEWRTRAESAEAAAGAMREALEKIGGLAGSCVIQRAPSDDNIIADHIEEIRDIAGAALAKARGVL